MALKETGQRLWSIGQGAIEDVLNSDNSFSDTGLKNDQLTREAMKKANSYR